MELHFKQALLVRDRPMWMFEALDLHLETILHCDKSFVVDHMTR